MISNSTNKYLLSAKQICPGLASEEMFNLALFLMEKDKEIELALKEKEIELALKDKEKELALKDKEKELALKDKEKENEIAQIVRDKDQELRQVEAYYLSLIADLSQRELLELFFHRVADLARNDEQVILQLDKEEKTVKKNFNELYPKMTAINDSLNRSESLRKVIWIKLGLSDSVKWPSISNSLLYPILSSTVHTLGIRKVFLRSDLDETLKIFYANLSSIFNREIKEFNPSEAAVLIYGGSKY